MEMIEILREYNENALKQAIRTAERMASSCKTSLRVKENINKLIILCNELDNSIHCQLMNGVKYENESFLEEQEAYEWDCFWGNYAAYKNEVESCREYKRKHNILDMMDEVPTDDNEHFVTWFKLVKSKIDDDIASKIWESTYVDE